MLYTWSAELGAGRLAASRAGEDTLNLVVQQNGRSVHCWRQVLCLITVQLSTKYNCYI